jgi:hypothetical protein
MMNDSREFTGRRALVTGGTKDDSNRLTHLLS